MYSSSHSIFVYHITGEDPTNQPVSEVGSDQHNEDIYLKEENSLQETLPSDKPAPSEETSLLEEPDSGGIYIQNSLVSLFLISYYVISVDSNLEVEVIPESPLPTIDTGELPSTVI